MIIKKLELDNFRNYNKLKIEFSSHLNIIYGNNAQGKTNILEGIYTLLLTKSHRLYVDNSLIKNGEAYTKLIGTFEDKVLDKKLTLLINENGKQLEIDKTKIKKISDYISNSNIIIFYPEDLNLIKGNPDIRRRYLNLELSQCYKEYIVNLNDYNKLLKIRNDYLKKIKLGMNVDLSYFMIITNYMIDRIINIYKYRENYINKINAYVSQIYEEISGYKKFKLIYKPNIEITGNLKEDLFNKFKSIYDEEVKSGTTIIGPHKDDYSFYLEDSNLKDIGSQGQQRMAILAMKLAEIKILTEIKKDKPILLLDDVFSELDDKKKNLFLNYINEDIQVIITTTDLKNINKKILKQSKLFEIENGKIKQISEVE